MGFGSFFRDWLPGIGVIAAGIWVLIERYDRAKREKPALNVSLTVQTHDMSSDTILCTTEVTYFNHSPYYVHLSSSHSELKVFSVPSDLPEGRLIEETDLCETCLVCKPLQNSSYSGEPSTESKVYSHFTLVKGKLYLVKYRLRERKNRHGWTRSLLLDTRAKNVSKVCNGKP